jgi:hypothetical protein
MSNIPTRLLLALSAAVAGSTFFAGTAEAQPGGYYGPRQPAPQGYYSQPAAGGGSGLHARGGRLMYGFSLGFGGMSVGDKAVECSNCTYNPVAVHVSAHIGGMVNDQLGLMLDVQGNAQTVEERGNGDTILNQTVAMFAAQYWVSPRLWIKGGIGVASLSLQDSASNAQQKVDEGAAVMGAVGYELLSNRGFSVDLQGRFIAGSYEGVDIRTSAGTVGVGINFF